MNQGRDKSASGFSRSRSGRLRCAILTLAAFSLVFGTACDEEELFRTFRSAASSSVQSGVNSIMDGVVDGLFAVFEQGTEESTESTSSTTTSSS
ncbi:MAG: hypothetical protein KKI02_10435 [Planctomycetes bacterium]|nr:hypothetical protein [Planctomycetota bacterium]